MQSLFIITYGRSCSTLLQNILNSIDGVCIRGENNNALVPLFRSYTLIKKAKIEHAADGKLKHQPWFGASRLDPDAYARSLGEGFVSAVLKPPEGAKVIGFKEIRYSALNDNEFSKYLDFMTLAFESTKFIFNTRNADEVRKSKWWRGMDPGKVTEMVKKQDKRFADYAKARPEKCLTICCDDYINNQEMLKPLFDFIGEVPDMDKIKEILAHKLTH